MAKEFQRTARISDLIHRELATLLLMEAKDPRFKEARIAQVDVSRDLSHAKVYISLLDESQVDEVMAGLKKASGFFRSELAKRLKLRTVPRLQFYHDTLMRDGNHLSNLINSAIADDEENKKD